MKKRSFIRNLSIMLFYAVCASHGTFCGTYSPYAK